MTSKRIGVFKRSGQSEKQTWGEKTAESPKKKGGGEEHPQNKQTKTSKRGQRRFVLNQKRTREQELPYCPVMGKK